eukprot:scaffold4096_cov237-Pinguiococcus_pyrenoidosus.AAC.2
MPLKRVAYQPTKRSVNPVQHVVESGATGKLPCSSASCAFRKMSLPLPKRAALSAKKAERRNRSSFRSSGCILELTLQASSIHPTIWSITAFAPPPVRLSRKCSAGSSLGVDHSQAIHANSISRSLCSMRL